MSKFRGHGEKFTRQADEFIAALLVHPSVQAAARAVKIAPATATRWMADEAFQERYRAARRDSMAQTTARLQAASVAAVEALEAVAKRGESESARVSAARAILEASYRGLELDDALVRIKQLEALMGQRATGTGGSDEEQA